MCFVGHRRVLDFCCNCNKKSLEDLNRSVPWLDFDFQKTSETNLNDDTMF